MVIDISLVYNVILGTPFPYQINTMINTRYLALKFLTQIGVATIQGYHEFSRQYAFSYLKGKKVLVVDQQGFKKESIEKD
jgi:hypothetical protein